MSKYTKGPWERDSEENIYIVGNIDKSKKDATYICEVNANIKKEEWQANAQRIVQCVNNFDELLEACKKAEAYFSKYHKMRGDIFADGIMAMKDCQQAIAKAEKEA